jgi:hypothetical protein
MRGVVMKKMLFGLPVPAAFFLLAGCISLAAGAGYSYEQGESSVQIKARKYNISTLRKKGE